MSLLAPVHVPARNGPNLGRETGTFQFKEKEKKKNTVTFPRTSLWSSGASDFQLVGHPRNRFVSSLKDRITWLNIAQYMR